MYSRRFLCSDLMNSSSSFPQGLPSVEAAGKLPSKVHEIADSVGRRSPPRSGVNVWGGEEVCRLT